MFLRTCAEVPAILNVCLTQEHTRSSFNFSYIYIYIYTYNWVPTNLANQCCFFLSSARVHAPNQFKSKTWTTLIVHLLCEVWSCIQGHTGGKSRQIWQLVAFTDSNLLQCHLATQLHSIMKLLRNTESTANLILTDSKQMADRKLSYFTGPLRRSFVVGDKERAFDGPYNSIVHCTSKWTNHILWQIS